MKFHKLLQLTRDITGQHYRPVPSDVSLPRLSERRRRLKFRLRFLDISRFLYSGGWQVCNSPYGTLYRVCRGRGIGRAVTLPVFCSGLFFRVPHDMDNAMWLNVIYTN